jgi:hypothetical protein
VSRRHRAPRSGFPPIGANVGLAVSLDPLKLELIYQVGDIHIGLDPQRAAIYITRQVEMLEQLRRIAIEQRATQ